MLPLILFPLTVSATEPSWQRQGEPTSATKIPFHSTQAIVLPTAEPLDRGMLLFEISHRFLPRFSDGHEAMWGLDGPANIRFGLGYGLSERLTVTIGRSNLRDNYDLSFKYDLLHSDAGPFPMAAALQLGTAWNTSVPQRDAGNDRNFQQFAQFIVNAAFSERLSVGLVPSYLHNYDINADNADHEMTLGIYSRFQTTRIMALLAEWNLAKESYYYSSDPVSLGLELETGGHFFKMVASNSTELNLSQYLPGASERADPKNWHFGFLITRLLKI
jgi:hypothetical protein